ncbi:MAG: NUDIX domain-containing protein [Ktedonobacteraceae bacterium]|nr:NUDIX domain-containing protein [Ktedonobacteraceae bacterium]
MAKIIHGERAGRLGKLSVGCSAVIFNETHNKVLLTRRSDNGRWCLPGGHMEAGESVSEACEREVMEETGLHIRVIRLAGIYSDPHRLVEYADGNRYHIVNLNFEAEIIGGTLQLSEETTAYGYFTLAESESMDLLDNHDQRIRDTIASQERTVLS